MSTRDEINHEVSRILQNVRDGRARPLTTFSEKILAKMDPKLAEAMRVYIGGIKARAAVPPANACKLNVGFAWPTRYVAWRADAATIRLDDSVYERLSRSLMDERYRPRSFLNIPIPEGIKKVLAGKVVDCKPYRVVTQGDHGEIIAMLDREEVLLGRMYAPHYLSIDIAPYKVPVQNIVFVKVFRPYIPTTIKNS